MSELPRWAYAIKRLLLEKVQGQTELAEGAGLSPAALSAILNGHAKPRADTFEKIATALGVDIVELFCTEHQARLLRGDLAVLSQQLADLRRLIESKASDEKSDAAQPRPRQSTRPDREKASDARKNSRIRKGSTPP